MLLAQNAPAAPRIVQILPGADPKTAASVDQFAGEAYVVQRLDVVIAMNADGTGYTERTMALKDVSRSPCCATSG